MTPRTPEQVDRLWATYHHIKKLHYLGEDEQGNRWAQGTYGSPRGVDYSDEYRLLAEHPCGTDQCFAGWYATLRGVPQNQWGDVLVGAGAGLPVVGAMSVSSYVRQDAGLSYEEADYLFNGFNSLLNLKRHLMAITGEDRG